MVIGWPCQLALGHSLDVIPQRLPLVVLVPNVRPLEQGDDQSLGHHEDSLRRADLCLQGLNPPAWLWARVLQWRLSDKPTTTRRARSFSTRRLPSPKCRHDRWGLQGKDLATNCAMGRARVWEVVRQHQLETEPARVRLLPSPPFDSHAPRARSWHGPDRAGRMP